MAGYTSGKFGLALCDQCGQQFKLNQLKKEWTGFKVCDECYEPKHPQLEPKRKGAALRSLGKLCQSLQRSSWVLLIERPARAAQNCPVFEMLSTFGQ